VFLGLSVLDVVSGVLFVSIVLFCNVLYCTSRASMLDQTRLGSEGVFNLYHLIYCERVRTRVIHVE
jgi:hypothetical protein